MDCKENGKPSSFKQPLKNKKEMVKKENKVQETLPLNASINEDNNNNNANVNINDSNTNVNLEDKKNNKKSSKKKKRIILFSLLGSLILASAITIPVVLLNSNKETIISDKVEDLLPSDQKTKELIVNNVDISNTKVVLGKDFSTDITLKEESKVDFDITGITVYSHDAVNLNDAKNLTSNDNLKKLEQDKDYTFVNDKKKASLKVNGTSFKSKLELYIDLKEINFNRFVDFNDMQFCYDGSTHPIKFTIKKDKSLPTDTSIKYTYNDEVKTKDEFFSFINAGTYNVTLYLTAPGFTDYSKSINVTIDKKELSDSQKSQIYFENNSLKQKIGSLSDPIVINNTGIHSTKSSDFEYYIDGKWTTSRPEKKGEYKVKKTLSFQNYNDYTIEGDFIVDAFAEMRIIFDVKSSGGTWGGTSDENITTDAIEMFPTGVKFGVFIDNLKTKIGYKDPCKTGHSFNGEWYDEEAVLNKDSIIGYNETYTVKAKFDIGSYKINFDGNGGSVITPYTNLDYNKLILEHVATFSEPTHLNNGLFKGWGLNKDDQNVLVGNETMPDHDITLYAKWYKYDFEFINGDHGTVTSEAGTSLSNLISLKEKPSTVTINADSGYTFNKKYDVYFGDTLSIEDFSFEGNNEIAPGKYNIKEDTFGNNVKVRIKPKFEALGFVAIIEPDGGIVKKGEEIITTLDIKCGDTIINHLSSLTATKEHTVFKNKWLVTDGASTKEVDASTLMPAYPITLKPIYHTYTINVVGDNNVIVDQTTKQFNNRICLYSDEIKYTINDGFIFKGFEYSFDGVNYLPLIKGMPFRPYDYDSSSSLIHDVVYVKVLSEQVQETMEVFLDAGEGLFSDGSNVKIVKFNKGKSLQNILDTIGDVKLGSLDPNHWIDKDNNVIDLDATIVDFDGYYYAKAVFVEEVQ